MSETPRSDAALVEPRPVDSPVPDPVKFARQLERELTSERIAHITQTNMAQRLFDELSALRSGVEKLAAEYTRLADTSDDEDFITEKRALARELRALLK